MPERTTITQVTQLGVEVTPGQAVPATVRLQAVSIAPSIQAEVNSFRPQGAKFQTIASLGKEWTEAGIEGVGSYTDLAYLLASVLAYAPPTGIDPVYTWTFEPAQSVEDTVKTYTVEHGSPVRAGSFAHGIVTELGLSFSRESVEVSGSMLGHAYQDGQSLSGGATALPAVPILPARVDIYLDSDHLSLGNTQLLRDFQANLTVGNRFGPLWPLNSSLESFATVVELEPQATLQLRVAADAAGMGPLAKMRSGDRCYIRIRATGPVIADADAYQLTIDLCAQVGEPGEFGDEEGVYAIDWTFNIAYDEAWGRALSVTLVNNLASL